MSLSLIVERLLEERGFKVFQGFERGEEYRARWFKREGAVYSSVVIVITRLNPSVEEEEGEEEEEEREQIETRERAALLKLLGSKYPYEMARMIADGVFETPLWLEMELIKKEEVMPSGKEKQRKVG